MLRLARRRARLTVAGDERVSRVFIRRLDGGIGKRRQIGERFFETGEAGQVTPRDADHLTLAPGTKRSDELGVGDGAAVVCNRAGARA